MNVFIACDHGGFRAKQEIIEHLQNNGISVQDFGCDDEQIVRYPYYAAKVAKAVLEQGGRGILLCSTGIGMSIIANKYPGIRAALVTSTYTAKMTRMHNDSNILCLGGKTTGIFELLDIVKTWLSTDFMGDRHTISLGLIEEAEKTNMTGAVWQDPEE